jgi:4-amino-4-deoxy-L-arabinose transferase-like glycosyltransferase
MAVGEPARQYSRPVRGLRLFLSDPTVLLAIIVLAGLALRLVDAGSRINTDEGYSWLVASAPSAGAFLNRLARFENTPPLFYLLLVPLPLDSEFWLRLPSIVAGTLSIPVLYAVVRPMLGARAALLSALGLAVAPFAVSFADFSRGFMVAGLGVLVALLGVQRVTAGDGRRWWWCFVLGGTVAMYSEYYSALYLIALIIALVILADPRRVPRRELILFAVLPFVLFLPWIPELIRSLNDVSKTKLPLPQSGMSPGLVRDALVPVFYGAHGAGASAAVRSLQFVVLIGVLGWGCLALWRHASRQAFWLLAGIMLMVLVLYFAVSVVHTDIFKSRYMTTVIPLGVAVVAGAVVGLRWRPAVPLAAAALVALAVAIVVTRAAREYEPDTPAAVAIAQHAGYRVILTNSSQVAFYGRRLDVILDRPFGISRGRRTPCSEPCTVIDDGRFGGVRAGPGPRISVGPIVIRFPPGPRP